MAKQRTSIARVRKNPLEEHSPLRTCYVCLLESYDLIMVIPGKFRCTDCNPGSANWEEYLARKRGT